MIKYVAAAALVLVTGTAHADGYDCGAAQLRAYSKVLKCTVNFWAKKVQRGREPDYGANFCGMNANKNPELWERCHRRWWREMAKINQNEEECYGDFIIGFAMMETLQQKACEDSVEHVLGF